MNRRDPRTPQLLEDMRIRQAQKEAAATKPYHGDLCPNVPELCHPPGGEDPTYYAEPRSPPGLRPEPLVAYWDEATRRAVLARQQQEEQEQAAQQPAMPETPASPEVEVVAMAELEGDHQGRGLRCRPH